MTDPDLERLREQQPPRAAQRAKYQRPEVVELGDVRELTKGQSGPNADVTTPHI